MKVKPGGGTFGASWNPPMRSGGGGAALDCYRISWALSGNPETEMGFDAVSASSDRVYNIENLQEGERCRITVAAANMDGYEGVPATADRLASGGIRLKIRVLLCGATP